MNGTVAVTAELMARVASYLAEDPSRERGGFLLGRLGGDFPEMSRIEDIVPCPSAPATRFSLTFRPEEWQLVHAHPAVRTGTMDIVGWFHSHPGMPVRMSSQDRFIHRHFFTHPGHVAWIRDPVSDIDAFWCMRNDEEIMPLAREPGACTT